MNTKKTPSGDGPWTQKPVFDKNFDASLAQLDALLGLPGNYGIVKRPIVLLGQRAVFYYAEGLSDTEAIGRVAAFCLSAQTRGTLPAELFAQKLVPYGEVETGCETRTVHAAAATGALVILCEAFPGEAVIVKARNVPCRSLEEPELDKVLRGAHVGFGETLNRNCALLRRALPSADLRMKVFSVGSMTETKVVLCWMRGKADPRYLTFVEKKLSGIRTDSLNLGIQSLTECLVRKRVWNPFPRFRYTERPDAAAASLCEGSILLLCDNAPQAITLPVSIFSFLQETNDFYLSPFTGTYLRQLRLFTFLLSVYLIPVWYALIFFTDPLPHWLSFLKIEKFTEVPVLIQLLLIELAIDALKLASMNTPSALSNSLSVIGGLILGDFAVQVGLFLPETILFMSVVAIAHFTQHNYELGYAFKYVRVAMLLLTAVLGWRGIFAGTALFVFLLLTVPTLEERRRYFYPLIPFNGHALFSLFFRRRKEA